MTRRYRPRRRIRRRYGSNSKGPLVAVAVFTVLAAGGTKAASDSHPAAARATTTAKVAAATAPDDTAAATAIAFARARLGCPYTWGGTGPCAAGYDCSGLVMDAYAQAGVTIPRTSQDQWATLPHVPASQVKAGDLVFFAGADGTPASPGHVGLVINPATHTMINAYATGMPVLTTVYGSAATLDGLSQPVGYADPIGAKA